MTKPYLLHCLELCHETSQMMGHKETNVANKKGKVLTDTFLGLCTRAVPVNRGLLL